MRARRRRLLFRAPLYYARAVVKFADVASSPRLFFTPISPRTELSHHLSIVMIRNKAKDDNYDDDDDDDESIARDSGRDRRALVVVSTNATRLVTQLHTKTRVSHVCIDHSLAANRRRDDDASSLA